MTRLDGILVRTLLAAIVVIATLIGQVQAQHYLKSGDIAAISGGTLVSFVIAHRINSFDSTATIFWQQPNSVDRRLQYFLGGEYYPDKTNFIDGKTGSAITPIAASLLLGISDLEYPQGDKNKTFLQDQFLFVTGIGATKAVTGLTKGLFRRTRPMLVLEPELAAQRTDREFRFDHQSFMSGHTSSAFFSMAFLNMRVRSIMRSELSPEDYRTWRWLPPTICFSWASFVGWSRVSIFKHYVTDVAAGALTGWLMAELFASFAPPSHSPGPDEILAPYTPLFFQVSFPL